MTQEEKALLLKDLCSRLPYKLRVKYYYCLEETTGFADEGFLAYDYLKSFGTERTISVWGGKRVYNIVPYLRPMSSMTEDEKREHYRLKGHSDWQAQDYLDSIHVDYRGLIWKGLALEAPEGMYENEIKSI